MSPRSTLTSCGSSSRWVTRSKRPSGVHCSSGTAQHGVRVAVRGPSVRSLTISASLPPPTTRTWRNSAGRRSRQPHRQRPAPRAAARSGQQRPARPRRQRPLGQPARAEPGPAQRDQRDAPHLVQAAARARPRPARRAAGTHADVRAQLAAGAQRAGQPGSSSARPAHDDPADPVRPDQSGHVGYGGVAGDAQPQLRMLAQQPGQLRAGRAGRQPAPSARSAGRGGAPRAAPRTRRPGRDQRPPR